MMNRDADLNVWISLIKGEYREMPCLQLTKQQVRRMWSLAESDCEHVLDSLRTTEFLKVNARGCYVLADHERTRRATTARVW